jgi:type VI secretion system protein VasG
MPASSSSTTSRGARKDRHRGLKCQTRLPIPRTPFSYDDEAVKLIVSWCTEVESGGRMIDAILTNTVLPEISHEFLRRTVEGKALKGVRLAPANGSFEYQFE